VPVADVEVPFEALSFRGPTIVGGLFESSDAGCSYFAGYLAYKLCHLHTKKLKTPLQSCQNCDQILTSLDYNLHLFVNFKDFKQSVDSSWGLKYCSEQFILTVESYEKLFLYLFHNYSHLPGFSRIAFKALKEHVHPHPTFYNPLGLDYLINFFLKCRIFHSIKFLNSKLIGDKSERKAIMDKIKKISNV